MLTFDLWVTSDTRPRRLRPRSQISFLTITVSLRHFAASERCMDFFCGCGLYECVCVCVCLSACSFVCVLGLGFLLRQMGLVCFCSDFVFLCVSVVWFLAFRANKLYMPRMYSRFAVYLRKRDIKKTVCVCVCTPAV